MEILAQNQYEEYEAFCRTAKEGSFMQSIHWAEVKSNWRHEVVVSRRDGAIVGGMSILIMPMGPGALMYAPRGPVCDYGDREVLADLLAGARAVAKKHRAHILKMDPYLLEDDREKIALFQELGCRFEPDAPFKGTIQPRYNYMLPYIGGMTEEQLMAGFARETRYYIRYPQKKGVECKNMGLSGMDDFYKIYSETGRRQGFSIRPRAYLEKMLTAFPQNARLYMCYHEGKPLCGGIALQYAGKTAHVYGCSTDEMRNLRPTYLLQWELMRWALEGGCTVYDMQGVAVRPEDSPALYGVLGFKQNFTGEIVTTAGEFCVVYRPVVTALAGAALRLRGLLHRH